MNEEFQQALKAEDLDAIRTVRRLIATHGWAGADPTSVGLSSAGGSFRWITS